MNAINAIAGIIPPILTPMNEDESINEKELRNQVNRLIGAGVHGIFALGTNGEGYILSEQEKEVVLSVVIDETKKRVPVYAGTGCVGTRDTIKMSQTAKSIGADILSIITPSFAQASQEELYLHYKEVASSVDMPIILYNIPARTGNSLTPATVKRLSDIGNIAGVKDSSGNFDNMLQYIECTSEKDFAVLSGNDSLIFWNLAAGGKGGIAGCANVYPENMVQIYESFKAGRMEDARIYQDSIRSLRSCFRFGNPNTIIKAATAMLGYPVGKCRSPFNRLAPEAVAELQKMLDDNGALGVR